MMACVYNACNADTEHEGCHNSSSSPINMCKEYVENLEDSIEDDEEEEDTDFNPFLVAETSSEASSSLSSDDDVSGHMLSDQSLVEANVSLNHIKGTGNQHVEAVKHVQHVAHVADGKGSVHEMPKKNKNLDFDSKQGTGLTNPEVNAKLNPINNIAENTLYEKLSRQSTNAGNSQNMCTELDSEDAICRRTRAHHSLANYTLEELETFLQESDDEDNLQNIDDEEEYNKFLAAVLQGAHQDGTAIGDDVDFDEDEENDMDFEIEIEEALESDSDDFSEFSKHLKRDPNEDACGPQTRQKRCQNNQKKLLGPSKMTLRPILPSMSNAQAALVPQLRQYLPYTPAFSECSSLRPLTADFIQGFTAQQIGQLYYLMLEHIQLLIQIFSLCVLDPSRQHIAQNVRNMIIEMTEKREAALASKKVPYPMFCFDNLHIHLSDNSDHFGFPRGSSWVPSIKSPIFSVFDVASLGMAKRYMTNVSAAVLKYRDSQVDGAQDKSHMIKQPLFHWSSSAREANELVANNNPSEQNATHLSSSTCKRKMSLAATLVENTKKQSIAQVPKGIADLAQRFVPLFNPELFPRKPPIPAVANRVLFTESEDRLLAMGLIEYNNNWEAIQQRFLPCKSKNQIFVRQKNRSSSKSPDNPIKIVRRMKTSPLTANELILISEGLKIFKNDWNAIWRFYVPYRDPSLLPRQWRIATGTQKSYRKSDVVKQKRNAYEAKRRKLKASSNVNQATSEKEVEDDAQNSTDNLDEDDEAYVHEAFLAESEPGSSKLMRPPTSQAGVSTHQMHKANPVKVVKLAPGLPPVNLPPSVRVISQSAFKSYNSLQSHPNISDGTCDPVRRLPDFVKNGNTLTNPRPDNKVSTSHPKADGDLDSNSRINHFPTEGNYPESDDTVHPLLLRTSGNGYQAHHQYQHHTSTSGFLLSNQFKDSQGFLKFQQPDGIISSATKHSKESPSNLHTIDFHPVLRRNDSVHGDSGNESQDNDASDNLDPFCTTRAPNFNSSIGVINAHEINDRHHVPNAESTGRYENESEIDLDIHLSTRNKGEKAVCFMANCQSLEYGKSSVSDKRMTKSILSAKDSSIFQENCRDAAIGNPSSSYYVANVVEANFISGASGGISCIHSKDDEGGADFPEIVMEQEELSDSDEEIEHVEFEHEEMDDSDDDQIHDEYISEIQNQEINSPTKGDVNSAEKNCDQSNASCSNMSESKENSGNFVQTNLFLDSLTAAPSKQRQAGMAFSPGCSQTDDQSKHRQYKARKAKSSNPCSLRRKKSI